MIEKSKDGVELFGLGEVALNDVLNDPNGVEHVEEDEEYYYVFPNYEPGTCGDSIWMVNKSNHQVSFTDVSTLIVCGVINKLKEVPFEVFRKRVS